VGRTGEPLRTRRAHALGVATCVALATAVVVAAAPGSPVRAGGIERGDAWSILFVTALGLAFCAYLLALLTLRRGGGRFAVVCVLAAAIQLAPLAGPLLLSRDVYSYWAYARISADHEADPYATAPASFPHDPATRAVAPGWRPATSVYGPAFTATAIAVDRTAGSPEAVAFIFRALTAFAAIGAALLAAQLARRKSFAAAFVGWNPLLAVAFAGGGHNDALMLVLILAALALARQRRDLAAGVAWIVAGAVKAPALFLLPLHFLRARRRALLGVAVAALAASVLSTVAFGTSWLSAVLQVGNHESRYAIPVRLEQAGVPDRVAHLLALAALLGGSAWLARQAFHGRARLSLGFGVMILTTPWLLPWYSSWPVVLAAVEEDAAAQVLALALAAYLLPSRVPF
jgi:hypothetical protein